MRVAALLALTTGCARPAPPPPPDPATQHVGVWEGSGVAFPEGRLCLVFCPRGRFFAADTICSDLAHPDFQRSWTWSRQPDGLVVAHGDQGDLPMQLRHTAPGELLVDLPRFPALPMRQVDLLSPVCIDGQP